MFHDRKGHWDASTTCQCIIDQFWWPSLPVNVASFVKGCIWCQKSKSLSRYLTTLWMPLAAILETLSIDFAGPIPVGLKRERYLLIAVEHLTGWLIARCTKHDTSDIVRTFVQGKIVFTFGPAKVLVSDNVRCFIAIALQEVIKQHGIAWKTVGIYATMSNVRAKKNGQYYLASCYEVGPEWWKPVNASRSPCAEGISLTRLCRSTLSISRHVCRSYTIQQNGVWSITWQPTGWTGERTGDGYS